MHSQIQGRELFEQDKEYAFAYIDGVFDRNVFSTDNALAALNVFDESLPG